MTVPAEDGLAELLLNGLGEIGDRVRGQLSALELLALTSTRMLVSAGAIDMARLTEKALVILAERDSTTPALIHATRVNLGTVYDNEADLASVGVTFHTFQ